MKHSYPALLAVAGVLAVSGCASITGTASQPISVSTHDLSGVEVKRAECKLNNSKGQWYVVSPGTVMVVRSNDDLLVLCEKEGMDAGHATVVSAVQGMMFGNVLFGGVIGIAIDHAQGSGYAYPNLVPVIMGKDIKVLPVKGSNEQDHSATEPAKAGATVSP